MANVQALAKRAAFAPLASLALHDKRASDRHFVEGLPFIELAATDDRNFVKKGISWALRVIGSGTARSTANPSSSFAGSRHTRKPPRAG